MTFKPAGLLTGIGSVPFSEPGESLEMVFGSLPEIPHWPQMPQRGAKEGFVFQFLTPLVKTGLIRLEGDRAWFDTGSERWGESMADFYTLYLAAVQGDPVALEAMAAGTPVLVSDTGGLGEIISHGIDGLKVPPGRPDLLARYLHELLNRPELARKHGQRAYRKVVTRYDWSQIAAETAGVYAEVLKEQELGVGNWELGVGS